MMVVGINIHFKIPIGYKFINGVPGAVLADLMTECLNRIKETGVRVVAVTADGLPANVECMRRMG